MGAFSTMRSSPPESAWDVVARLRGAGCVFAEDEARVLLSAATGPEELERMLADRVAGLPLERIVGFVEFCGLRIVVQPRVFVPRQRTALLVHAAAAVIEPGSVVVDLCCGTGAVGAALLAAVPGIEVLAADLDPAAVACAQRNLPAGSVLRGDLYDALPDRLRRRVDVLAVNAPYVPTDAIALMPPEARDHEPAIALDGGADGLDVQRRVVADAPAWLRPGGHLLVETGRAQASGTAGLMTRAGMQVTVLHDEEIGGTVVTGRLATQG